MTMTMKNYFLRRIIEIQLESLSVILKFLMSARAFEDDVYFYLEKYFQNTRDIHPNNLVFPSLVNMVTKSENSFYFHYGSKYYHDP